MPPPSAPRTKFDEVVFLTLVVLLPVMQPLSLQFGSYAIPLADLVFLALCPAFLFMVVVAPAACSDWRVVLGSGGVWPGFGPGRLCL